MLSAAQIKARAGKLTGSRIALLMQPQRKCSTPEEERQAMAEQALQLYEELLGLREPEDLRDFWPARLGEVTEQLQLDWYEEHSGMPVIRRGEVVVHPDHPWAACTLDGFVEDVA